MTRESCFQPAPLSTSHHAPSKTSYRNLFGDVVSAPRQSLACFISSLHCGKGACCLGDREKFLSRTALLLCHLMRLASTSFFVVTKRNSYSGGSPKPRHSIASALRSNSHYRETRRVSTLFERPRWNPSSNEMDSNSSISRQQRSSSSVFSSNNTPESSATVNTNNNNSAFVNHALVLWKERRQEWVGARQHPKAVEPREPVIRWAAWDVSWSTTYEDLLATSHPFSERIPLTEMVDFLVDVWEQEGLYE